MTTLRALVVLGLIATTTGCVTTRAEHQALVDRVGELERQQTEAAANRQTLDERDRELRDNLGDLTVRFDDVEQNSREVRGVSEEAGYLAAASSQEVVEMRANMDSRLKVLEERLKEATGIPETKSELWAEAERLLAERQNKQARRLWRMFEVRYPDDPRMSEVVFSIGLTHYAERDYRAAIIQFHRIAETYGRESEFLADSLYYAGLSFEKLGQCDNAIRYFETIVDDQVDASDRYETEASNKIDALKKDEAGVCLDREAAAESEDPGKTEDPGKPEA